MLKTFLQTIGNGFWYLVTNLLHHLVMYNHLHQTIVKNILEDNERSYTV